MNQTQNMVKNILLFKKHISEMLVNKEKSIEWSTTSKKPESLWQRQRQTWNGKETAELYDNARFWRGADGDSVGRGHEIRFVGALERF